MMIAALFCPNLLCALILYSLGLMLVVIILDLEAIFLNYLSQNNTLSEKIVFNGVALFYSIIVSILLMKLTISNEVTKLN